MFAKDTQVMIGNEKDGTRQGRIRSVIAQNRKDTTQDDRLVHTTYVVEYTGTCLRTGNTVDTVTRFHQRRDGSIFNSRSWKMVAVEG